MNEIRQDFFEEQGMDFYYVKVSDTTGQPMNCAYRRDKCKKIGQYCLFFLHLIYFDMIVIY